MTNPENIVKHQFKKGKSGNPNGRPPVLPELKEAIAKVLSKEKDGKTALEKVLNALYNKAIKGDVRAAQVLLDRAFGKPHQTVGAEIKQQEIKAITFKNVSKQFPDAED